MAALQTKTIHEYLADNPDVDVTETHAALYGILTDLKARVERRFPDLVRQEASKGLDYWSTESGDFEGSLTTYSGPGVEHLAHSWVGNRKASILDMNLQVWLDQRIDVPHLVLVFGTIPDIFFYSDLVPRFDLMVDVDHLSRYYVEEDADFLALRGDPRLTWSVSHGTYMRAFNSPVAHSYTAARTSETVELLRSAATARVERWLDWVERADEVPEDRRAALRARDHAVRTYGYTLDPMNAISERFLGRERVQRLLDVRYGKAQINAAAATTG
jgi:Red chlorophyll catabolite reductase (RCC reductase)